MLFPVVAPCRCFRCWCKVSQFSSVGQKLPHFAAASVFVSLPRHRSTPLLLLRVKKELLRSHSYWDFICLQISYCNCIWKSHYSAFIITGKPKIILRHYLHHYFFFFFFHFLVALYSIEKRRSIVLKCFASQDFRLWKLMIIFYRSKQNTD